MKSWIVVLAVAMIPVGAVTVGAFVDDAPKTEEIMKALFKKGATSKSALLKREVEAASPNWEAIQKTTKEIAELGASLEKAEPEKGSLESWKKMAGKFGEHTKALHAAAEAKDLAKVKAAQKTIGNSCKSCHEAHRGK
jgi:cytochrome c556